MSLFDNHLDSAQMRSDEDKIILASYKISNSGHTLIPRKGTFGLTAAQKRALFRRMKTEKLPEGTFKEEKSIFCSMYGKVEHAEYSRVYPVYEGIIREMNLPCLVYNQKRYYQVNRGIKRQIAYKIRKVFDREAKGI